VPQTIGYHLVKTTYGTWLPGDERGHWSSIFDPVTWRFIEHRKLHPGQPARKEFSHESMKYAPFHITADVSKVVEETLMRCQAESDWKIIAGTIEATHLHLLITYTGRSIDQTARWLSSRLTTDIHQNVNYNGPVWTSGKWAESITDERHWQNLILYVEQHNIRRGLEPRPYRFLQ
jgi:REP element-mobilizing transposase RayT